MYKKDGRPKKVLMETGDALLWQTLASVVIPGFTINRICAFSQRYMQRNMTKIPPTPRNLITVAIGLASIPIIIHPIDGGVTLLMNLTYRKWVKSE
ncbi:mitochondrial fission process protein 1 [Epargyreus clarus]|uniref:mitochondrial fission process protein 1 n=1 Tax=Epargyreus clarus TaxID=520877 RepID=UPI003C2AAD48